MRSEAKNPLSFLLMYIASFLAILSQHLLSGLKAHYVFMCKVANLWVISKDTLPSSNKSTEAFNEKLLQAVEIKNLQYPKSRTTNRFNPLFNNPKTSAIPKQTEFALHSAAYSPQEAVLCIDRRDNSSFRTKLPYSSANSSGTLRRHTLSVHKRAMSSVEAKLNEYNEKNSQYMICKQLERQNILDPRTNEFRHHQLPKPLDYSAVCQFINPETDPLILDKLANLQKIRPSKERRHSSFEPTKLSAIFENLAY